MDNLFTDFHFIRPLWLLAILPALLAATALLRQKSRFNNWSKAIDTSLLSHLMDTLPHSSRNWPIFLLLAAWIAASVSLAGPAWKKLPQPVHKKEDALVIIQDLSLSMYAQDLSPNRLTRARQKLTDILASRIEGTTGLIVFSGDAHVVAPLTDDTNTITAMVPALSPNIMPTYGSDPVSAVKIALDLFKETAIAKGRILLLTDEVIAKDANTITKLLQGKHALSVIGIGTEDGGPIPLNDGGFFKDANGNIVIPGMDRRVLQSLAAENGGIYNDIQLTDKDFDFLLTQNATLDTNDFRETDHRFDKWQEEGPWLVLFLLLCALLSFRKGLILGIIMIVVLSSTESQAFEWQDLWLRKDQQAARSFANEEHEKAASLFTSSQWKGAAQYRTGNFADASESFSSSQTSDGHYNRGNSLAKTGQFEVAVSAYEKALELDPDNTDALFNKELIEKLMAQQEQQNQESSEQNKEEQSKDQDKQNQGEDQSAQNNAQEENSDQQQGENQEASQDDSSSAQQDEESTSPQDDMNKQADQHEKEQENDQADAQQENQAQSAEEHQDTDLKQSQIDSKLNEEQQQALEQWLRQVPDDPGGLLRRKFEYESYINQNQQQKQNTDKIW